jgi:tetratricopeptide (TPR) repeat protein
MIKNKLIIIFILAFTLSESVLAEINYFDQGKKLYEKKSFKESKFNFEKDIVFNPKNEKSYLYLANIFKNQKKQNLEENNLNTVILLNPKNEEAIYLLSLLNIEKSNFSKAKELINTMKSVCSKFCHVTKKLEDKLNNSLKQ